MNSLIAKISKYSEDAFQTYLDKEKIQTLHQLKLYVDDLYYNTSQDSGLTDWQYDMLKETIKKRDPNYLVPVGVRIRENENRTELPFWLGSMNKISVQTNAKNTFWNAQKRKVENHYMKVYGIIDDSKRTADDINWNTIPKQTYNKFIEKVTSKINELWEKVLENESELKKWQKLATHEYEEEINKWVSNNRSSEYIIEDKLDGVSCLMIMKNGKIKLYTRGDGEIGANISYLAPYFSSIPKNCTKSLALRGELIMKKSVFDRKYSKVYANPRNMVSGLVGGKTVREGLEDVDFIIYEIVGEGIMNKPSEQLDYLDSLGFKTVRREIISSVSVETLMEMMVRFKNTSLYEIDGLIVQPNKEYERNTSGNPDYAFAFKMRMEGNLVTAKVVSVDWNVSKWGQLKPRVEIIPVKLGGVTITWATGFNAKFIYDNSIGPNAIIEITRSGDVIPYIVRVVKKASEPDMPDMMYEWNETGVDIITEEYGDQMCIKLITNFFAKLGIKYVGEKNVEKIYNAGYDTLLKIIYAKQSDFARIPGFGERLAERTYDNIHMGLQNISLADTLGASGVFGFGLGRKKVTKLLDDIPNLLDIYKTMSKKQLLVKILGVEGFSDKTAMKIVENIEWADKFIQALSNVATFKEKKTVNSNMNKMQIAFSGFRDKKLEEQITERGGKVMTSVSSKTTIVVVANKNAPMTGKVSKASQNGVTIMDKAEFIQKYIK